MIQENDLKYYDDVDQSNVGNDHNFQTQLSNISGTSSVPATPEPGLINIGLLNSPTARSAGPSHISEEKLLINNNDVTRFLYKTFSVLKSLV